MQFSLFMNIHAVSVNYMQSLSRPKACHVIVKHQYTASPEEELTAETALMLSASSIES
jgi:hypothetical protein